MRLLVILQAIQNTPILYRGESGSINIKVNIVDFFLSKVITEVARITHTEQIKCGEWTNNKRQKVIKLCDYFYQ